MTEIIVAVSRILLIHTILSFANAQLSMKNPIKERGSDYAHHDEWFNILVGFLNFEKRDY
jgi:hypothetical protein